MSLREIEEHYSIEDLLDANLAADLRNELEAKAARAAQERTE